MAKYIINVEETSSNGFYNVKEIGMLLNQSTLDKLKKYEDDEKNEEIQYKNYRAKKNHRYYYISSEDGRVYYKYELNNSFDDWRYSIGNYFRTKDEAEEYKNQLIVYNGLKAFAESPDANWSGLNRNWYIMWDNTNRTIQYNFNDGYRSSMLNFSSEKIAKKAVKAVGEERVKRYYFGIKED